MNILITGASGYIGNRMVNSLLQASWVDKVVGTDIKQSTVSHPKFKFIKRDIRESFDDVFESEQIDTVVHTAYILPPLHDTGLMEDINKNGTRSILSASSNAKIKQLLYISSTSAYGFHADNDQPLTEESPLRGNEDFTYTKNKRETETIINDFKIKNPSIKVSMVRPCFVVGPGFKNPLAEHLKKPIVMLPMNTLPWQFVHEDDLVNVMVLLLEKQIEGTYNVASDGEITFKEMIELLGNIMLPLPWFILSPLNDLAWNLLLTAITEFPSNGMTMTILPWNVSNKKLKETTGYKFKYNTKSAFQDFANSVKNKK
jgi:UDP-glucose 4-epimerase